MYQNYHKHSYYSNIRTSDSVASYKDYCIRALEYNQKIISSVEHGSQGRYIECYELAKQYDLKFLFGTEAYFVKDRTEKDKTNAHIVVLAKNENGRQCINEALSEANISGFYYQPRLDNELLFSLPKDDVWITTACIAGVWKYDDYEEIIKRIHGYFGDNFFLEVQAHNTVPQKNINSEILQLKQKYGIQLIAGVDSHYIDNDKAWERDDYLLSKGISYEDESGWYMDYPSPDELYSRFVEQGILDNSEIEEAFNNTNTFLNVAEYENEIFSDNLKMPSIYPDKTKDEKDKIFEDLIHQRWEEDKNEISQDKWDLYEKEIAMEVGVVKDINHSDYFLLDYEIVQDGLKHGGQITNTGRGSAVSFYINKLLGFTKVDRIASDVKLYPERFLSKTRILQTGSIADIDLNLGNPEVFAESQKRVLGENHAFPMIAYGTYKVKSAWKLFAKSQNVPFDIASEVTKQIEKYEVAIKHAETDDEREDIHVEDYIEEKYLDIFEKSKNYRGIISSVSIHPCFTGDMKLLTVDGYKRFDELCDTNPIILGMDGKTSQSKVWCSGEKDTVSICLSNNGYIKCTPNHIFMLNNGTECKAQDLKGKQLMPYSELNYEVNSLYEILGFIQGDGQLSELKNNNVNHVRVYVGNKDSDVFELFKDKEYKQCARPDTFLLYGYNDILRELKFSFENMDKREFPKTYELWDIDKKKSFLRGCYSANGCVVSNRRVAYKTICKNFAVKLQETLLNDFGIKACIIKEKGKNIKFKNGEYLCSDNYNICIDSFKGIASFSQNIGFIHKYKKEALKEMLINKSPKVINVTINKKEKVYDFEEPRLHWGIVNGFVVHNCAHLIYQKDIRRNIGLIMIKSGKNETLCSLMDGKWAEKYKFLKNDLLKVSVVSLIKALYQRIGIKEHTVSELLEICTPDHKVWDVYKNGWTMGINQVEQRGTSARCMKYRPKNISELCSFVAAIRPGFKSMYRRYENREDFAYNIKTIDDLIRTPQFPQSYMLYQEHAMAVLNYAGIPMDLTYEVVKNIAKKRADKVLKYKETFLKGMKERIVEQEHQTEKEAEKIANMTWQIIEDSVRYSFNASHSLSVAIDSLYCAYLKVMYPLEFYETYIKVMTEENKKDKVILAQNEASSAFGIRFSPFKFGEDNRDIRANKKKNEITNSLQTVKHFSKKAAQALWGLRGNYDYFVDVLLTIKLEKVQINSRHLYILVKLDYFEEFGNQKELLKIIEVFNDLKGGESKTVSKENIKDSFMLPLLQKHGNDIGVNGNVLKAYKIDNCVDLLHDCETYIKKCGLEDFTDLEKIRNKIEFLGYLMPTGKEQDRPKIYVSTVYPINRKKDGKLCGHNILGISIGSGKQSRYTIWSTVSKKNGEFKAGDIIQCHAFKRNGQSFEITNYTLVN